MIPPDRLVHRPDAANRGGFCLNTRCDHHNEVSRVGPGGCHPQGFSGASLDGTPRIQRQNARRLPRMVDFTRLTSLE
jgi:hypothetical protein